MMYTICDKLRNGRIVKIGKSYKVYEAAKKDYDRLKDVTVKSIKKGMLVPMYRCLFIDFRGDALKKFSPQEPWPFSLGTNLGYYPTGKEPPKRGLQFNTLPRHRKSGIRAMKKSNAAKKSGGK